MNDHNEPEKTLYHATRMATFLCHMGRYEEARTVLRLAIGATAPENQS